MNNRIDTTSWLPAFIAGIALAGLPALATAQVSATFPDDSFLCYKGKLASDEASAAGGPALDLLDMFGQEDFDIKKERGSCNPADVEGSGIVDSVTHFTAYQIKRVKGAPKHPKQTGVRMVSLGSTLTVPPPWSFGEILLDTKKEDRILIPASKDDDSQNPLPDPPNPASHNVDHYKCYKAKQTKGEPKFSPLTFAVEDQWETPAKQYELKKPKLLCIAVDKNGEDYKNMDAGLVCFQAKPAKGEPKHVKREGVGFADQLIAHRLNSSKEELLCMAALKEPPLEFCGDGVINQGGLETCEPDNVSLCVPGQNCIDCVCTSPAFCGDGTIDPGETCETDTDCAAGELCSSGCGCIDDQCPGVIHWTRFSKGGVMAPLPADVDSGWTGSAHNSGTPDQAEIALAVSSYSGTAPACGVATIAGIDPSSNLCRCSNDTRTTCDAPLLADFDDCGGAVCDCFLDPPIPSLTQGIQTCSLTRLSANISGTWNVDTGEGDVLIPANQTTRFGPLLLSPCPTCDGDVTLNDGLQQGTCTFGSTPGAACDAQFTDPTFPVPGGGSMSLDCYPQAAVVAQGIVADWSLTTGASGLGSVVPCGVGGVLDCHCGVCQSDLQSLCETDADCPTGDTCGDFQPGLNPLPNSCDDLTCTPDAGDPGEGSCLGDPDVLFCDGLVRAEGGGVLTCNENADCVPPAITVNGGNCTLAQKPKCYPDTFALSGTADPVSPHLVSAVCQAPSNSPAANFVAGYPGPGVRQENPIVTLPCAGDPGSTYPGCP